MLAPLPLSPPQKKKREKKCHSYINNHLTCLFIFAGVYLPFLSLLLLFTCLFSYLNLTCPTLPSTSHSVYTLTLPLPLSSTSYPHPLTSTPPPLPTHHLSAPLLSPPTSHNYSSSLTSTLTLTSHHHHALLFHTFPSHPLPLHLSSPHPCIFPCHPHLSHTPSHFIPGKQWIPTPPHPHL